MRVLPLVRSIYESVVFRLLFISSVLYGTTYAVIGLSSRGGVYSPFVSKYLNYPYFIRKTLLRIAHRILVNMNYRATLVNNEFIFNARHGGIHVAYECLGFGVMSLWAGFVVSFKAIRLPRKVLLLCTGFLTINVVNVLRMICVFIAPFKLAGGWDNHAVYNILIHVIVMIMGAIVIRNNKIAPAELSPALEQNKR